MIKKFENFNNPIITYYSNGQKKSEEWLLNGYLYRDDGPAFQSWFINGQKKVELWAINGKYHREDGPTFQEWKGGKKYEQWWLNNKKYTHEKWVDKLKEIGSPHYEEQKMLLDLKKYNL